MSNQARERNSNGDNLTAVRTPKRIGKKLIATLLTVAMLIGVNTGVFASGVDKGNESTFSLDCTTIPQEKLEKMADMILNSNITDTPVEVGTFGSGKLYVKVDKQDVSANTRGFNTSSSVSFTFKYKNAFGVIVDAFRVILSCRWYNDGAYSRITNFEGQYVILNNGFSCEWDSSMGSYFTPTYCELYMNSYGFDGKSQFTFSALMNALTPSSPFIDFNYFEL